MTSRGGASGVAGARQRRVAAPPSALDPRFESIESEIDVDVLGIGVASRSVVVIEVDVSVDRGAVARVRRRRAIVGGRGRVSALCEAGTE